MTTMPEMLRKLTERETALFKSEQQAKERMRLAEEQVTRESEALMELQRAQAQELKVLKAQHEKALRDIAYECRKKVQTAQEEQCRADAMADNAELRRRRADTHAAHLTAKVHELELRLQKCTQDGQHAIAGLERAMTARLRRVEVQSDERVRNMTSHAREVTEAAGKAVDKTSENLQGQMSRAYLRAEGRVRFKELRELAKSRDNYDMSREAYFGLKGEILSLWRVQQQSPDSRPNTAPTAPLTSRGVQSPLPETAPSKMRMRNVGNLAMTV